MPRYIYHCDECEKTFQIAHSIKEKLTDCEECDSEATLRRIPTMPLILNKDQKTGTLVKEFIKDAKEDLNQEREHLSSQVYEND